MPFSDELVKCDVCDKHELWHRTIRINGCRYCKGCYDKRFKEDLNNGKEKKDKMSVR